MSTMQQQSPEQDQEQPSNVVSVPPESARTRTRAGAGRGIHPPRRWLMDRITGDSKYGDKERPACPCCWVPPPVAWCPGCLEENCFCQLWGLVGCYRSEGARCCVMHFAFFCDLLSLLATVLACLAISTDYELLTMMSFTTIRVGAEGEKPTTLDIGLRAIALDPSEGDVDDLVILFGQFCSVTDGLDRYILPEDCGTCDSVSANMVISLLMAAVGCVPTLFTDILRMYSGYDVNCQKFFASFLGTLTFCLSLNTILSYIFYCGSIFRSGAIPYDEQGQSLPLDTPYDQAYVYVDYTISFGTGLILLIVGLLLKAFAVMCHFCIPTPSVTRDRKEQEIYEHIPPEGIP